MYTDVKKILVIGIFFIIFLYYANIILFNGFGIGDFNFHLNMAKWNCTTINCQQQPPLYSWISHFFSFRLNVYWIFGAGILGLLIPFLLFKIQKRWQIVWFYFSVTNVFWFLSDGYYTMAIAFVLLLLLFIFKNDFIRIGIVFLGLFAHSHAFFMLAFIYFILLLFEKKPVIFFPMSSLFLCRNELKNFTAQKVIPSEITIADNGLGHQDGLTLGYLGVFFLKGFYFPFFILAVWQFFKQRRYDLLIIVAAGLFAMSTFYRVSIFVSLILLFGLTDFYKDAPTKTKRYIMSLSLLTLSWQIWAWYTAHIIC